MSETPTGDFPCPKCGRYHFGLMVCPPYPSRDDMLPCNCHECAAKDAEIERLRAFLLEWLDATESHLTDAAAQKYAHSVLRQGIIPNVQGLREYVRVWTEGGVVPSNNEDT